MKTRQIILLASIILSAFTVHAEEFTRELRPFCRIVVSPRIHVVLQAGDVESIRFEYHNIKRSKINAEVVGQTLRIYLDDARALDKLERIDDHQKQPVYRDASVTAYVTYKTLNRLVVRGSQEIICKSAIESEKKFKLKLYGENKIELASMKTAYFKTVMYGENSLKVNGGKSDYQKYKLYGENKVDASEMKSYTVATTIIGDNELMLNSQDELHITSFGEARVSLKGDAYLNKGLIFGRTDINRMN